MKKLLGILVLGLLWYNFVVAEIITLNCKGDYWIKNVLISKNKKQNDLDYIYEIDLKNKKYNSQTVGSNYKSDENPGIIVTDDYFYIYRFGPDSISSVITAQTGIFNREDGALLWHTTFFNNEKLYEDIKTKLNKINSKISNYEPDTELGIDKEYYQASHLGTIEQEMEKFNIVKPYAEGKNESNRTAIATYKCNKSK